LEEDAVLRGAENAGDAGTHDGSGHFGRALAYPGTIVAGGISDFVTLCFLFAAPDVVDEDRR
jgi:hypothetical protein